MQFKERQNISYLVGILILGLGSMFVFLRKPTQGLDLTDKEYNDFIDFNFVPSNVLINIAEKIKKGQSLSEKEKAVFFGKTSEINEIFRK